MVEALAHRFYNQIIEGKLVDRVPGVSEPKNFETVDLDSVEVESEHATVDWLNDNSALCELIGMETPSVNRHQLYATSRLLYNNRDGIENYLSRKTSELFDLQDKIILYDLTNTYFEGRKQHSHLAMFGNSKEKRKDARLVTLALVVNVEGFVKYSRIYRGNIGEITNKYGMEKDTPCFP